MVRGNLAFRQVEAWAENELARDMTRSLGVAPDVEMAERARLEDAFASGAVASHLDALLRAGTEEQQLAAARIATAMVRRPPTGDIDALHPGRFQSVVAEFARAIKLPVTRAAENIVAAIAGIRGSVLAMGLEPVPAA